SPRAHPAAHPPPMREPEPARQHYETDEREQHREPVHHAMHGLDGNRADEQPGRIGEGRCQQQCQGDKGDERGESATGARGLSAYSSMNAWFLAAATVPQLRKLVPRAIYARSGDGLMEETSA